MRVVGTGLVRGEDRVAHQVADMLEHIAPGVEAKMLGGGLVAPLDAPACVQQYHPIGRSLDSGQKLLQPAFAVLQL